MLIGAMATVSTLLSDRELRRHAGRYIVVGASGYAVQLGSFALMVHVLGVPYLPAAVIAGCLALANNFLLNRYWTFEVGHGRVGRQARNYVIISALMFATQLALLHLLVVVGCPKVAAESISAFAVVPPNFLLQRRFAFRA